MPKLQAVIFDMDGVLIDSEPFWQMAEYDVMNRLGLNITLSQIAETTGLRIDQVVEYWYARFPWPNYDNAMTAQAIVEQVVNHINESGKPMLGVYTALDYCLEHGIKVGLATSSSTTIINAVLNKLGIRHYFHAIQSAEKLTYGKPHPEVYLNCAHALAVNPTHCLAIEDSFNGLIAARAANMHTIAIPEPHLANLSKWVIGHHQLSNLAQLPEFLDSFSS
ncbi:hexitol phosphatase HxpB [Shewanella youngdeokensis]|uniref:Hexitol phosphatase HxpB n=1 Tax=Shewanella youngdeokensis TaxID=2999068 RepID=A0ABZ0JYX0_9GAMM|nr:hexitol phosphatase HxpB [Shewanella sp. DAU334]